MNTSCSVPVKPSATTQVSIPGLHIVANFSVSDSTGLGDYHAFQNFINQQIEAFGLNKVGEVYHNFPGGGYTGVVCLTESHLSIHTWPEQRYITFDVFLSNFLRDNRATTEGLYKAVCNFFNADILFEQIINR